VAGALRLAAGPASTQTLGIRTAAVCYSSRMCAFRRELNSHDAAKPRVSDRRGVQPRDRKSSEGNERPDFSQGRAELRQAREHATRAGERKRQRTSGKHRGAQPNQRENLPRQIRTGAQAGRRIQESSLVVRAARRTRHAISLAGTADAEYRDCSCCGAQREAEWLACKYNLAGLPPH